MDNIRENIYSSKLLSKNEFIDARNYLRKDRLDKIDESLFTDKDYVLACACIEKLMPSIPVEEVPIILKRIYYYKGLTWIQQKFVDKSINSLEMKGDLAFLNSKTSPRIFCTFHLGSYRLIPMKLVEQGIDLAVVIARKTREDQQEAMLLAYEEMKRKYRLTNTLSFIDAENSASVIQMVRALKEGKSLFFYIDGNTGVGGSKRHDEKVLPIEFLNASVFARKGVAYIAHKCKVPIILGLNHFVSDNKMIATFYPPIIADANQEVDDSTKFIMQSIYNTFSEALHLYPDQWEGWITIINFLNTQTYTEQTNNDIVVNSMKNYVFDKARFSLFTFKETLCLLDKNTFKAYPIQQELIDILNNNDMFSSNSTILPEKTFEFLVKNRILIRDEEN